MHKPGPQDCSGDTGWPAQASQLSRDYLAPQPAPLLRGDRHDASEGRRKLGFWKEFKVVVPGRWEICLWGFFIQPELLVLNTFDLLACANTAKMSPVTRFFSAAAVASVATAAVMELPIIVDNGYVS